MNFSILFSREYITEHVSGVSAVEVHWPNMQKLLAGSGQNNMYYNHYCKI